MKVLILGIGNILWADEGFGIRALETLNQEYSFDENVTLLDGGTQGVYLLHHVQECDILVVFDAVDYGLPSGELKLVHDEDVPKFMGAKKVSLHQTGFQEVLALADLTGQYPEKIFLIGVQPALLDDFGGSLTEGVKAQIQPAIEQCLVYLEGHNITATKRDTPLEPSSRINAETINMKDYEEQRPSNETALRQGDDRVIFNNSFEQRDESLEPDSDCNVGVFIDGRKHFEDR